MLSQQMPEGKPGMELTLWIDFSRKAQEKHLSRSYSGDVRGVQPELASTLLWPPDQELPLRVVSNGGVKHEANPPT